MSDYGLKVSEEGVDAKVATPEECIIHSGYPHLKTVISGTHEYEVLVNNAIETDDIVEHGLSYVPSIQAYIEIDGDGKWRALSIWGFSDSVECKINSTKLYLYVYGRRAGIKIKVKYYIFIDKIET